MKIKSIINFILIIILLLTAAGFGFYYLNLPVAKISKQHIKDMTAIYKKAKAKLEKPYNVGKTNLGKYNLGVLEIMHKRIKPISKTIVIKYINKDDIKKSLIQGKNQYYVFFGDTVTNDVFKNILVTINVLDTDIGPDDVDINDNEEFENEQQCDEDDDCETEEEKDDFL